MTGMADDLRLWAEVSQGLVSGFLRWQLKKGYSVGSVNVRLSTVQTYTRLAAKAGHLPTKGDHDDPHDLGPGRNIDERREVSRVGHKKVEPVAISPSHIALIKSRLRELAREGDSLTVRVCLLFCLLADHGLRCSEVAALAGTSIDL